MTTDFRIADHGSIVILRAISDPAKDWVEAYLPKDAQHGFGGTVIERRYFADIYDGITTDGLTIS